MKKIHYCWAACTLTLLPLTGLAAIVPGQLKITEIMANPATVSDSYGEWFEILNTTNQPLDLTGLVIRDDRSSGHAISIGTIPPGGYFLLARNGDSAINGGIEPDYVYSGISLGNSEDRLLLEWQGELIDSISYMAGSVVGTSGQSAEVTLNGFRLTDARFRYGAGDIGTPGFDSEVPIPAAGWLFGSALAGLLIKRRAKPASQRL